MAGQPNKKLALAAAILGSAIALLDGTIVSVALPTIQRHLGGGLAGQQWITSAYLLTLGSLILIGGSLGDIFGERRIFTIGVAGFGAASLLCALAPSIGVLIAARALQGVAGALLTPSSLAVIVATFDDDERGAAIGTWTAFGAIANVIGPLAGGELLAIASWRWLFLINLPLVAITIALIRAAIPVSVRPSGGRRKIDFAGAALCAGGLAGVAFALIEAPRLGWSSPAIDAGAAGAALLAGFLVRERFAPDLMLPPALSPAQLQRVELRDVRRLRRAQRSSSSSCCSSSRWVATRRCAAASACSPRRSSCSRSHAASARSRGASGRGGSWPRDR